MAHTFIFHQPLLHSPLRRCKSTKQFPRIAKACEKLKPNTLVDGEIVALDGKVSNRNWPQIPRLPVLLISTARFPSPCGRG